MAKGQIEKRGSRKRQVKKVILIVTEGSQTEPKYFNHFRTRNTNIDIRVVGSRSSSGETDYMSLIRKAQEYQKKNQLSSSNGDSVWVVADGDVNFNNPNPAEARNQQLGKARKAAERSDIQIALSNPCFEYWYLLHFRYTTKYLRDYVATKKELTPFLPNYEKADDVYAQLAPLLEQAIQNAKQAETYHCKNNAETPFGIEVNPFTEVYRLIEELHS